jgi:cysteine desulfurase/selenocysteine lyase
VSAAIGLGAAVEYLAAIGMEAVREHERGLTRYALEMLPREVPGIRLHGPRSADERSGIVTFNLPDVHPHDVATLLDREAIAIRAGHHCTQPLHERLGETATARASFNVYSTTDDLDRLAAGLRSVQRIFSRTGVESHAHPSLTADPDHAAKAALPAAPTSVGGAS